jgi:hypothetical protein
MTTIPLRQSVSLLRTSPITLWSISTGIRLTSCWIRCFNSWTMWGAGALKTWDFRYPQRKKSHAERSPGWPCDVPISGDNMVRIQIPHSCHEISWGLARSSILLEKRFFGYWMTSKLRTLEVLQHVNVTWSSRSYSLLFLIFKEVRIDNSKWRYRAPYCDFGAV